METNNTTNMFQVVGTSIPVIEPSILRRVNKQREHIKWLENRIHDKELRIDYYNNKIKLKAMKDKMMIKNKSKGLKKK